MKKKKKFCLKIYKTADQLQQSKQRQLDLKNCQIHKNCISIIITLKKKKYWSVYKKNGKKKSKPYSFEHRKYKVKAIARRVIETCYWLDDRSKYISDCRNIRYI